MRKIRPYAKAVVAFVAPGAVVLTAAVQDASPAGEAITSGEWITAACACLITSASVFKTSNETKRR